MLSRLCVLAGLALLLFPGAAAAVDAPRPATTVAVLEFRAKGLDPRMSDTLLDVVAAEVALAPALRVISRKEIEALLTEESRRQLLGCDQTSCLAEIAGALDAELLVTGEVARLPESLLVSLQLINNRYATVMNRVTINWPGSAERLPDVVQAASQLLVFERGKRAPGTAEIAGMPEGALVFLDEKPLEGGRKEGLEVGMHTFRLEASGHEDRIIPVIIKAGKTSRVNGAMERVPIYKRPWFWSLGIVGTGLVGAAFTGLLLGVPLVLIIVNFGGARLTGTSKAPALEVAP